jgi:hypothetical protein
MAHKDGERRQRLDVERIDGLVDRLEARFERLESERPIRVADETDRELRVPSRELVAKMRDDFDRSVACIQEAQPPVRLERDLWKPGRSSLLASRGTSGVAVYSSAIFVTKLISPTPRSGCSASGVVGKSSDCVDPAT